MNQTVIIDGECKVYVRDLAYRLSACSPSHWALVLLVGLWEFESGCLFMVPSLLIAFFLCT